MRWYRPLLAVFAVQGFSAFVVVFFSTVVSIQTATAVQVAPPFMIVEIGFIVLVVLMIQSALMAFPVLMAGRSPSRQMVGAIALTLASVILISGVWCIALSPTSDYTQFKDRYEYSLSIEVLASKSVTFTAERDETIEVSVGIAARIMKDEAFDVYVFDPEGEVIWQDLNVTDSHLRTKALKSGTYELEVKNLSSNTITCSIYINRMSIVTIRPLEPAGQWLSLISLPIFGLGIWASGIYRVIWKGKGSAS